MSSSRAPAAEGGAGDDKLILSPLWNHVEKISKAPGGGGNYKVRCKFCSKIWSGSYSRVKKHFLGEGGFGVKECTADPQTLKIFKTEHENALKHKAMSNAAKSASVPLPQVHDGTGMKKTRMCDTSIGKSFNLTERDVLDCMIARMFYASGLPFNLARSPYFRDVIMYACSHNLKGYTPPSYDSLRTTHLTREKENIERMMSSIKTLWSKTGVSLVSDGWTDVQRRPLINFVAVSPSGPMFLKAEDASGEYKDTAYMGALFMKEITEIGAEKVVQIITDNAPVCRAAGLVVEAQHPSIFWTPCVVHTLNLALKNICAPANTAKNHCVFELCKWILEIDEQVRTIQHFINNHTLALSIYKKIAKLKLLSVAERRFASTIQMLARFQKVKDGLEQLVMSEFWKGYRGGPNAEKSSKIKENILSDQWWDKIDYILEFTNPIVSMLRECDIDRPTLHLVYEMWDSMIEKVKKAIFRHEQKDVIRDKSKFYNVVEEVLISRWTKSNTPLHCMAHSLNPKYYSDEWLTAGVGREPPHVDREVSINREEYFRRLFPNDAQRIVARSEFGKFSAGLGDYGKWEVMTQRSSENPLVWWSTNGSSTPLLQALATRLLSQPSSSSCSERNWSTFSHIHTLKRNRMDSERVDSLVFVHSNLRLLSRSGDEYKTGPSKSWDSLGQNLMLDGPILQDAELYLDDEDLDPSSFEEGEAEQHI